MKKMKKEKVKSKIDEQTSKVDTLVEAAVEEVDGRLASGEAVLHASLTSKGTLKSAGSKLVLAGLVAGLELSGAFLY